MLQVGAEFGRLTRTGSSVFAQLVQRGPVGLQLRLHGRKLLPHLLRLLSERLHERRGFVSCGGKLPLPLG